MAKVKVPLPVWGEGRRGSRDRLARDGTKRGSNSRGQRSRRRHEEGGFNDRIHKKYLTALAATAVLATGHTAVAAATRAPCAPILRRPNGRGRGRGRQDDGGAGSDGGGRGPSQADRLRMEAEEAARMASVDAAAAEQRAVAAEQRATDAEADAADAREALRLAQEALASAEAARMMAEQRASEAEGELNTLAAAVVARNQANVIDLVATTEGKIPRQLHRSVVAASGTSYRCAPERRHSILRWRQVGKPESYPTTETSFSTMWRSFRPVRCQTTMFGPGGAEHRHIRGTRATGRRDELRHSSIRSRPWIGLASDPADRRLRQWRHFDRLCCDGPAGSDGSVDPYQFVNEVPRNIELPTAPTLRQMRIHCCRNFSRRQHRRSDGR